ncbi:carotenoid oxygenase family protein [Nocardioides euryhalodurans]|uniref:Dioxygenase n=1 Tax=Nocardioides euryhalodurans TaxID=2518370 RepID=A0A4P7GJL5_9ACTN|nr:carotenoid oxygenase family protein [Nocardioides euryhalodurans]QBR91959.1 carotenoid oxygenase [Nocardioides euryhalodurans]
MSLTATTRSTTNRYLRDNFAPVREELTATDLTVTGDLPDHLDGRYLRIGPNPLGDPGDQHHWFLGEGMVHGVRLRDGEAQWYRNRWVRSADVATALDEPVRGRPGGSDFAANTNVLEHAGRTLALVEGGSPPYELTHDLDTVGPCDFGGTLPSLPGRPGYSAHPHEDPVTGELHAVSYSWMRGNRVDYSVLDTSGRIRRSVEIQVHGSPMMHDFALTERHVVILDLPVTFDVGMATADVPRPVRPVVRGVLNRIIGRNPVSERLIAQVARGGGGSPSLPYRWNPDYPARIGVLPRDADGEAIRWFEIDPCFVFHTLNAYDDGEQVVVDVIRHPRMFATVLNGPDEGAATMARFTLDLASGTAREVGLDQRSQEFPRHDERLTGRRHRYGYAVGFEAGTLGDTVLRHDLDAGTTQVRRLGAGAEASEFCFVPRPGGTAEDDGVLLGYVHRRAEGLSDLRVLDAATLEDVAAVHLPGRVPAGFHGNWSPTRP